MSENVNIIIIASGPRYRSSLLAGMIDQCGAFGGCLIDAGKANPTGFFENRAIKELCVIRYIETFFAGKRKRNGRRKHIYPNLAPVPFEEEYKWYMPPMFRERVLEIFRRDGWDGEQTLYFKLPLAILMAPVWHYAFPEAKWIVLERPANEVREALIEQGWMPPIPEGKEDTHGYAYISMYERALEAIKSKSDINWKPIDMLRILNRDFSELQQVIKWAGMEWNPAAADMVKTPEKYKEMELGFDGGK